MEAAAGSATSLARRPCATACSRPWPARSAQTRKQCEMGASGSPPPDRRSHHVWRFRLDGPQQPYDRAARKVAAPAWKMGESANPRPCSAASLWRAARPRRSIEPLQNYRPNGGAPPGMADVRASQGTRQMARSLPIAWLVLLAACAQAPAPAHGPVPVGAIAREPAGVRATPPSTAPAAPVGYRQEVDKLLGELAAKGAQPGGATDVATPCLQHRRHWSPLRVRRWNRLQAGQAT